SPAIRSDAWNGEELGRDGASRPALPAVAQGEPVRLVASALQQTEGRAAPRQSKRLDEPGQEDLLLVFGQADDRQLRLPDGPGSVQRRTELALTAVDHPQAGGRLFPRGRPVG